MFRKDRHGDLAKPITATVFEGRVARVHGAGDALQYADGPEYRRADELQRIVDQLPGKPVCLDHPAGLIADGTEAKIIGTITSARVDGDYAVATFLITDEEALKAIKDGTRELSLGYTAVLDADRFQTGITLDHLAIVDGARCGPSCRLRADDLTAKSRAALPKTEFADPSEGKLPIENEGHVRAAMARFSQTQFGSSAEKKAAYHHILSKAHSYGMDTSGFEKEHAGSMDSATAPECTCTIRAIPYTANNPNPSKVIMDELQKQLTDALTAVATQTARANTAETALATEKARADKAELAASEAKKDATADLTAEKARADKAEADLVAAKAHADAELAKAHADAKAARGADVKARIALETAANRVLGAATDRADISDRDLKIAIIKHVDDDDVSADAADLYVDGAYDGALKRHAKVAGNRADTRTAIVEMRKDTALLPVTGVQAEKAAADKVANDLSTAWMTPAKATKVQE